MCEEVDHSKIYKPVCQADGVSYKEKVERNRIFEFLVGLNYNFELVRVNILSRDTLPSLNEVYAFVQSEESKKHVIQQYSSRAPEQSALIITVALPKGGKEWC